MSNPFFCMTRRFEIAISRMTIPEARVRLDEMEAKQ